MNPEKEIPYGYCHCGCGQKTKVPDFTFAKRGIYKGTPRRYIHGHNGHTHGNSYLFASNGGKPNHRHVIIAEGALRHKLPQFAVVHHIDENKKNAAASNLVICQNRAYHNLIHARMRAKKECGNAGWRRCQFCRTYDDPKNLYISPNNETAHHRACRNKYRREQYRAKRP